MPIILLLMPCFIGHALQHAPTVANDVKLRLSEAINELNQALNLGGSSIPLSRSLHNTGSYIDYCNEFEAWVQAYKTYEDNSNRARLDILEKNKEEWIKISAERTEAITWDWCPIWWIMKNQPILKHDMPPQPWKHDGMFKPMASFFIIKALKNDTCWNVILVLSTYCARIHK